MKNLLYNIALLLFALIQTYVAFVAIIMSTMIDGDNLPIVIVMWVLLVGLAFVDKFIRKIKGWLPLPLCFIVSPLRGVIQFIILIITIVNLCRRADPVCERGVYNPYSLKNTLAYVTLGINFVSQKDIARREANRAAGEETLRKLKANAARKKSVREALLEKDPNYFQLENALNKIPIITGHLSNSYARVCDARWEISYKNSYTEMYVEFRARIEPTGDIKEVKAARSYYYSACQTLRAKVQILASSDFEDYKRKWPFSGNLRWSIGAYIDESKFRL